MYRKQDGSIGFSFTRFMNNAAPNLAANPDREADVPALGRDSLYGHQINAIGPHAPFALDDNSLYAGGICASESLSATVIKKLRSADLITSEGFVDTRTLDGRKFAHQLAILPSHRQKDLIKLLFWWEEECVRLRKLIQDETDLTQHLEEATHTEDQSMLDRLGFEREKIRMRIKQKPSERIEDVEMGNDALFDAPQRATDEEPPTYSSATRY